MDEWVGQLPPGYDLTLGISYDRSTGRDTFFVDDNTAMVALSYHGYAPGTGQNYRQARVGAEFAADPWSTSPTLLPPPRPTW